jgi:outer membrane lipoprotein LolB
MSVLGQRVAELEGNADGVTLRMPDEAPMHAQSSEELLASVFGVSAPVEGLRYWVMGLPRPFSTEPENVSLDERGHLLGLDQDGWRLNVTRYMSSGGLDVPDRLTLDYPRVRVRLVIDEWSIERAGASGG